MNFGNLTALRDLQLTVQGEPEEGQGRTYWISEQVEISSLSSSS